MVEVFIMARFLQGPTSFCQRAVKRVLIYLEGSCDIPLTYTGVNSDLTVFVD